jgi:TM2 domain-containing membrane protein YozV
MADNVTRLLLQIRDDESDSAELAELTISLRQELLDLDVNAADQASGGQPPLDSRALEVAALGTLVVSIVQSPLLGAIVNAVTVWLTHRQQRTVRIEIDGDVLELTGLPSEQRRRLTEEWLRRHTGAPAPAVGTRSALIIASRRYDDPGLRLLRAPVDDAEALARVLGDPNIGGFDLQTLIDAPSYEVCEAIEEFFADRSPDDVLLMHFSGHGVKDESGELHFAMSNTKLRRLAATAIAADFVNRRMNRSRSRRIVLLLDCCYAGAFERGLSTRGHRGVDIEEQFGGGRGHAVITASSSMEYAFEGDQLTDANERAPSVFTSALVEGLDTGDADRDQDGQVALDELYDYVYDKVRESTPNQTPGKWTFGVQGDIYVARRARPVTKPATLPGELQEAIDHPMAGMRIGAVHELTQLLRSRHAGVALAARAALQELADDDSRTVSAAATAALAANTEPETATPTPTATARRRGHSDPGFAPQGDVLASRRQRQLPPDSSAPDRKEPLDNTQDHPLSDKRKLVAGLLQIFLGALGVGRFYTGHFYIALLQIAATAVTIPLVGLGGIIWGIVDGAILLTRGGTDAHGRVLRP